MISSTSSRAIFVTIAGLLACLPFTGVAITQEACPAEEDATYGVPFSGILDEADEAASFLQRDLARGGKLRARSLPANLTDVGKHDGLDVQQSNLTHTSQLSYTSASR